MKKIISLFTNPYSGPILVVSLIVFFIFFNIFPKYSEETKEKLMTNKAIDLANNLKDLRKYYTINIISKIEKNKDIKINSKYNKNNTIPLPATFLHDLSELYVNDDIKIKLYSNYPFPNRKDRILDKYEETSLKFLINNPNKIYKQVIQEDGKKAIKVAISDILFDKSCVNCHNTRADSPKTNWKLNDVRGALSITLRYSELNEISLSSSQSIKIISILVLLILILIVHYTIFFIRKNKHYNDKKIGFEKGLAHKTQELSNTVNLLDQYKYAVDKSAIVSKTNSNGIITYVNDEFLRISKYSRTELIGNNHNVIKNKDKDLTLFKNLWKTINEKKVWKGEIKNIAKDGSIYYVSSTIIPIHNSKNEVNEYLAVMFDITDSVESKLKAQKADDAKSIFLANMSHEIRTPLNAIIGFSEVLRNSENQNIQNKKQAAIINTSANSLLEIINDILDVSKIESGNFDINLLNTNLYSICEHIVELFSKKANENSIKLVCNIDSNIPVDILTDEGRLRQVISNILSNAIKFTPEFGEVTLNVSLILEEEKFSTIRFEVIDSGIGIPEDKLVSIFDPFIQVDHNSNRKFEGTGLGLSICSHIVKALGSEINVESIIGSGSKFYFDLKTKSNNTKINNSNYFSKTLNFKVEDVDNEIFKYVKSYLSSFGDINNENKEFDLIVHCYIDIETLSRIRQKNKENLMLVLFSYENSMKNVKEESNEEFICLPFYPSKLNDSLQNLFQKDKEVININKELQIKYDFKVLVAEDNNANQELIKYNLETIGVDFTIKDNGLEAFNEFKCNSYDIVLTDINMPIMDGIELLNKIREYEYNNSLKETAVVAITANSLKGDKEKFLKLGMSDYLSKPINTKDLTDMLKKKISEKNLSKKEILKKEIIIKRLGVSENIVILIIDKFRKEIYSDLKELQEYIKLNDEENISNKAHYIKNSCLNVCLDEVCELLKQLEDKTILLNQKELLFEDISNKLKDL